MFDEYEIVQAKIDKIGEFRFQVRSWAVGLFTAVVGASAIDWFPWYAPLGGNLLLLAFQSIEEHQNMVQGALVGRAYAIEVVLSRSRPPLLVA